MKRGFLICLLVFGLTYAAEDNIGTETKDVSTKTSAANINFRFYDKNKRGATKLTNTDSPSFNHLTASNTVGGSSTGSFKPAAVTANTQPFRYLYNQQFYQPNPYLTYLQLPQAAQIAAQYSIQSNPVAHFLQTPNQIQYVAAPTVAQVPQIKFQGFSNEYSSANTATSDSATSSATSSQYVPQQTAVTSSYVPSATSGGAASSSASVSQTKQVQVPFYSGYQAAQPVYYTPQPLFTYFPQAQAANFIYQQPNANFLLKQQQQHQQQLASLYGANRFGLYTQTPNTQLTYLVPMVVPQPQQDGTTTTSTLKSSADKTVSSTQQSASSNSYTFGTKA